MANWSRSCWLKAAGRGLGGGCWVGTDGASAVERDKACQCCEGMAVWP